MPRGSRPGERRGGRAKGTPNKSTRELALLVEAKVTGEPLAKEILRKHMHRFDALADAATNPEKRDYYSERAVACARWLAPFQSPTYRSIVVEPPPMPMRTLDADAIVPIGRGDPHRAVQVYQRLLAAGRA